MIDLNSALNFAKKVSLQAGNFIKKQQIKILKTKTDAFDIQTTADLGSEKIIIQAIKNKFPNHNILSEEIGYINNNSPYTWVLDPLDGTKEFIRNIPNYSINITLEDNKNTLLGVCFNPITNYMFFTSKNNGAYLNHKKISVSNKNKLAQAFIYTHLPDIRMSPHVFENTWKISKNVAKNCYRLRGIGEDVNSLCNVAMGAAEGFFIYTGKSWGPKWWDIAAGILLVSESGGKVTDFKGNAINNKNLTNGIIAANTKIHQQLLSLINS